MSVNTLLRLFSAVAISIMNQELILMSLQIPRLEKKTNKNKNKKPMTQLGIIDS